MRLLCLGCLHGKIPKKLVKKLKKEKFDYVLCTGDLVNGDEFRKLNFKYWNHILRGYTFEDLIPRRKLVAMESFAVNSMQNPIDFLKSLKKPVFLIYGNHDYLRKDIRYTKSKPLEERIKKLKIRLLRHDVAKVDEFNIVGYSGYRYPTFKGIIKKKGIKRKEIQKFNKQFKSKLDSLFSSLNRKSIFITHDPPLGYFDKIINKESPLNGKHIGDIFYLEAIKRYKPILHVSTHMHEHQGKAKLGNTLIVSTGAAYLGRYVIVDIEKNKVKSVRFGR